MLTEMKRTEIYLIWSSLGNDNNIIGVRFKLLFINNNQS